MAQISLRDTSNNKYLHISTSIFTYLHRCPLERWAELTRHLTPDTEATWRQECRDSDSDADTAWLVTRYIYLSPITYLHTYLHISSHIYSPICSYNLALVTVLGCILGLTMYLRARTRGQARRQAEYSAL